MNKTSSTWKKLQDFVLWLILVLLGLLNNISKVYQNLTLGNWKNHVTIQYGRLQYSVNQLSGYIFRNYHPNLTKFWQVVYLYHRRNISKVGQNRGVQSWKNHVTVQHGCLQYSVNRLSGYIFRNCYPNFTKFWQVVYCHYRINIPKLIRNWRTQNRQSHVTIQYGRLLYNQLSGYNFRNCHPNFTKFQQVVYFYHIINISKVG